MRRKSFKVFQSIFFKIPLLFLFILLIAFQFIGVIFMDRLESQSVANFKSQINTQGEFLATNLAPLMSNETLSDDEVKIRFRQTLDTFASNNPTNIWVLNTNETIVAANQETSRADIGTQMSNPFVREVLLSHTLHAQEVIDIDSKDPVYHLGVPIFQTGEDRFLGMVIIEASMSHIYAQTSDIVQIFIQSAILAVIVSVGISIALSQGLTRPIENMRQQAIRIAEGVYNYPAEVLGHDELGELTVTINELADKVKDAQESTESERQRLDSVLRHMRDGVIGTDRRGNIILVNERALYLLNLRQEEALGKSILEILDIESDYTIQDLMSKDTEIMVSRDTDDFMTIISSEFSVIRRETGFVTGLVCVLTDVTEQEKTEQERRDFVSNVSHELRTPLTSVKSYSDALIEGAWRDDTIAPQFLEVIQMEANRMIRMVSNLLDLSKIDDGQIKLQTDYVDFKRVLDHILDRAEFNLQDSPEKYHFERIYSSGDIYVDIDQDRMTQVIENILNNAIKYSPDGGTITVKLTENHQTCQLSIADEGLGISPEDSEHLFERFYRVDKARSRMQGGSGLGLAISKEVVELHHGRIWVDSIENVGSTFVIELPMTDIDIDEDWG